MKKVLLSLLLLSTVAFASAQQVIKVPARPVQKSTDVTKNFGMKQWVGSADFTGVKPNTASGFAKVPGYNRAPAKAEASSVFWWGYPTGSQGQFYMLGFDILANAFKADFLKGQTGYNVFMVVPSNYANCTVDSLANYFIDASKIKGDVTFWFNDASKTNIPVDPTQADYYFTVKNSDIKSATKTATGYRMPETMAKLPKTYTIPASGCIVGYAFTGTAGDSPIVSWANYEEYGQLAGSYYFTYQGTDESGNPAYGSINLNEQGVGSLSTILHIDATNAPKNNVSVGNIGEFTTIAGQETELSVYVYNDSYKSINGVSYVLTIDGNELPETEVKFQTALDGGSKTVLTLPSQTFEEGNHEIALKITKVDGLDNISKNNSTDGLAIALEKGADRQSVVEELTSQSCVWCIRGLVGMDKLKKSLGNSVIALAHHFSYDSSNPDPMELSDNMEFANTMSQAGLFSGFPTALFDRYAAGDPYYGIDGTKDEFSADKVPALVKQFVPSEASVDLVAEWADDAKTKINAKATYNFGYDRMDGSYGLAFILSEDGLTGTTNSWKQYNGFNSVKTTNPDFTPYVGKGDWIDVTYNDVVVGVWGSALGIDNSVNPLISKDVEETYNETLNIAGNKVIQDKDKLKLTVLLINRNNLSVVNAAQVDINGVSAGIKDLVNGKANATEIARYNANGQLLKAPQKGLNIIKLSNGKSLKVVVK